MEGFRSKLVGRDGCQVRLVEFAPGFSEAEWCHKAHVGYVLAGCLEVEFTEGAEVFSPGDALVIAAGDRHRARVIEGQHAYSWSSLPNSAPPRAATREVWSRGWRRLRPRPLRFMRGSGWP
jgi:hypothetical protein